MPSTEQLNMTAASAVALIISLVLTAFGLFPAYVPLAFALMTLSLMVVR